MKSIVLVALLFSSINAFAVESDDYVAQDEATYRAMKVPEQLIGRGVNSLHYLKLAGRLECRKTTTRDHIVVGYLCNLSDPQ